MASYIEVAEILGKVTNSREEAKKFVENFALENKIPVSEVFAECEDLASQAKWERKLEGYLDY